MFKPSSDTSFVDIFVFAVLFLVGSWSPTEKGHSLADLLALLYVVFSCVCVTFPYVSWSTSEVRVRLVPLTF